MPEDTSDRTVPPAWGKDTLSHFIEEARWNTIASYDNAQQWYERLLAIDGLFRELLGYNFRQEEQFVGLFLLRCHSAFLGAVRMALSGQVAEAYMCSRGCLEAALYALWMHLHPETWDAWRNRHKSDEAKKAARRAFVMAPILEELRRVDPKIGSIVEGLYGETIDLGGHPNPRSIFGVLETEERGTDSMDVKLHYLTADPLILTLGYKKTAQIGVGALYVFRCVLPERFDVSGLTGRVDRAAQGI